MPEVLGIDLLSEAAQRGFVFRLDRPHFVDLTLWRPDFGFEPLRIGPDRESRLRRNIAGTHANPAIHGDHAPRVAKQRIDVDFGDFAMVGNDLTQLHMHADDTVDVGRRPVAIALEQSGNARAIDLSRTISTAVPPCPNRITGPKVGSVEMPAISS